MTIVLATRNPDKVREVQAILRGLDVTLVTLERFEDAPQVVEDGETLEENALKKARAIRDATGMCALADDTGLEVDALGGAPGVFSARYAGEGAGYRANNKKLLGDLKDVPDEERTARFRCVIALALTTDVGTTLHARAQAEQSGGDMMVPPGTKRLDALVTEGVLEGRIIGENRGSGGFGYDPVFMVPDAEKTLSEMGDEAKNRISHRYRALVEIRELLIRWGLARSNDGSTTEKTTG